MQSNIEIKHYPEERDRNLVIRKHWMDCFFEEDEKRASNNSDVVKDFPRKEFI